MPLRLRLIIYNLLWIIPGFAGSMPKIRVNPSSLETGTVYQYMGPDIQQGLLSTPNIYMRSQGYTGQSISTSFRGLTSPHALVLLDGIAINDASAGQADLSHFARSGVNRMSIQSGPEVLLRSNQAGGIIQLDTSDPKVGTQAIAEMGSFKSMHTGIKSTFQNSHGMHTLLANHEQTNGLPKYDRARMYGEKNRYHQENGGMLSHLRFGNRTWLKTHARAINSVLKYDDGGTPLPYKPQATQNAAVYLIGAEANHESSTGKWQQQLAFSHARHKLDYDPYSFTHSQESTMAYRHDLTWSWAHRTRLVADSTTTSLRKHLGFQRQRSVNGLAALHSMRLTDTWHAEVGVRQDYTQKYSIPPRLTAGLSWEKNRTKLYGSWRQAMRLPTLYDLHAEAPYFHPNSSLKQEKLDLIEMGWKQNINDQQALQAVYFHNRLHHMMVGTPINATTSTIQNLPRHAILQGLELSTEHKSKRQFLVKGSYTLTSTSYPKGTSLKPITPKHRLYLQGEILYDESWTITPSLEYIGHRFSMNRRLNPYILNHLEISYLLKPDCRLYGQIKNLWDERYETVAGYRSPRRAFYVGTRFTF